MLPTPATSHVTLDSKRPLCEHVNFVLEEKRVDSFESTPTTCTLCEVNDNYAFTTETSCLTIVWAVMQRYAGYFAEDQ